MLYAIAFAIGLGHLHGVQWAGKQVAKLIMALPVSDAEKMRRMREIVSLQYK